MEVPPLVKIPLPCLPPRIWVPKEKVLSSLSTPDDFMDGPDSVIIETFMEFVPIASSPIITVATSFY